MSAPTIEERVYELELLISTGFAILFARDLHLDSGLVQSLREDFAVRMEALKQRLGGAEGERES